MELLLQTSFREKFAAQLVDMHVAAGRPTYQALVAYNRATAPEILRGRLNRSTLSELLNAKFVRPPDWQVIEAFVDGCHALGRDASGKQWPLLRPLTDLALWRFRHTVLIEGLALSSTGHTAPSLEPPYQSLPRGAPDVWLLQPRFGVVPYLGRTGLLDDLAAWCQNDRPFAIATVSGDGGSGKSRLAAHLCARLSGWTAGWVTSKEMLEEFTPETPALLVIDYPERFLPVLGPVLEGFALRLTGPPVRVLLLDRTPAVQSHWWTEVERTGHGTASLFTTLHIDLSRHALHPDEKREHAEAAVRAFAEHLEVKVPDVPDVTGEEFVNPLLVHVAALLAVRGEGGGPNVLAHLLTREQARWTRLLSVHQLGDLHHAHAVRAVVLALLTGPSAREIRDVLAALPEFAGLAQAERRGRIGYWLAELYPGASVLGSFGPDLLVEELLDSTVRIGPDLDEVVAAAHLVDERCRARLLNTLSLAAVHRPAVHGVLQRHLVANLSELVRQALDEPDGVLAAAADSALVLCEEQRDAGQELIRACAALQDLPRHHEHGAQLLCTTLRLALPLVRASIERDPSGDTTPLASVLQALSYRCTEAGRHEDALAAMQECVALRRRDPDRNPRMLAIGLDWLASALLALGRRSEALAAAEEGVALVRHTGDGQELATALNRLSCALFELGRHQEALEADDEALSILRVCAEDGPQHDLLSIVLSNRGAILNSLRRYEEAMDAIAEADRLREWRADQQPTNLNNAASVDVALGRYEQALTSAERAVEVSRRMAGLNPRRHRITLIHALDQLAHVQLRLVRSDVAVTAIQEAVGLGRQGTRVELITALARSVDVLVKIDRYADALPVCREAVTLLRASVEAEPGSLSMLVETLIKLSEVLHALNRPVDALDAARTAVELTSRFDLAEALAKGGALINLGDRYASLDRSAEALEHTVAGAELLLSVGHSAALVSALTRLASLHLKLEHRDEASAVVAEAVRIGRTITLIEPSDLGFALCLLGEIRLDSGDAEQATAAFTEAVRLCAIHAEAGRRRMAALASAFHGLVNAQIATGHYDQAADNCQRAVELYERLASVDEEYLLGVVGSSRDLHSILIRLGRVDEAVPVAYRKAEAVRHLAYREHRFSELLQGSYMDLIATLRLAGHFDLTEPVDYRPHRPA
ncbi:tetratricopeptide repeat protein [Umezawaea sp. Da 62-37]|uniref:tetratricopeptide repeat protein n=1 Tax=Umezawaea sp. Da 62-37 TaxID=3075927 RepID=UPI0028F6C698|nr:tetratricopeptide repeat protein [Umezawaea sp. Da 62-37]WNV83883.1 tetratricopeptide repeat protein [Umezawaea sp. Da 62-37]